MQNLKSWTRESTIGDSQCSPNPNAWPSFRALSLELSERIGIETFFDCTLCGGELNVIRKEAWPFYRTISGVRLYWELEEPKGPKKLARIYFALLGLEPTFLKVVELLAPTVCRSMPTATTLREPSAASVPEVSTRRWKVLLL